MTTVAGKAGEAGCEDGKGHESRLAAPGGLHLCSGGRHVLLLQPGVQSFAPRLRMLTASRPKREHQQRAGEAKAVELQFSVSTLRVFGDGPM